jgi:hypothetical protein
MGSTRDKVFKTREMLWKYTNLSTKNVGKGVNYKFYIEALKYNGEQLKHMGVDVMALSMSGEDASNDFQSESNLSAFAGLFGFSEGYSALIKPMGFNEITIEDYVHKVDITPETISGNDKLGGPGGMVSLVGGVILINVGLKCPNAMVDLIRDCMGIDRLVNQAKKLNASLNVKLTRSGTWDHSN